jgi:glycine cleavage system transcriptional repressor
MMILAEGPDDLAPETLEKTLAKSEKCGELTLAVRSATEGTSLVVDGSPYMVSVYGCDHPGIVHRISTVLADKSVNITDVNTRVIGEDEEPVYAMLLEVTVPRSLDQAELDRALQATAAEVGVEVGLHPAEADVL